MFYPTLNPVQSSSNVGNTVTHIKLSENIFYYENYSGSHRLKTVDTRLNIYVIVMAALAGIIHLLYSTR